MYILKKEYNMNEQKEKKVIIILPPRENHLNILIDPKLFIPVVVVIVFI